MISMLRAISHIGVTDDLPERETRRIVFLNILVLGSSLRYFDYFLTAAYLPSTWMPLIVVGASLPWVCLTLYWTHLRRYLIARIWFCGLAVWWTTLLMVLLGTEPRFQLFLVVCIFSHVLQVSGAPKVLDVFVHRPLLHVAGYCGILLREGGVIPHPRGSSSSPCTTSTPSVFSFARSL